MRSSIIHHKKAAMFQTGFFGCAIRQHWAPFVVLAGALSMVFWPVLSGQNVLMDTEVLLRHEPWKSTTPPHVAPYGGSSYNADSTIDAYPAKLAARNVVLGGELPLWNPPAMYGQPLISGLPSQVCYPSFLLFLLLPPAYAFGLACVIEIYIGGLFTYLFARLLHVSRWGAAISGLMFMLNFIGLLCLANPIDLAFLIWTPPAFYFAERYLTNGSRLSAIGLALVLGLNTVGSHLHGTSWTFGFVALYILGRISASRRFFAALAPRIWCLAAAIVLLAALLAAIDYQPQTGKIRYSVYIVMPLAVFLTIAMTLFVSQNTRARVSLKLSRLKSWLGSPADGSHHENRLPGFTGAPIGRLGPLAISAILGITLGAISLFPFLSLMKSGYNRTVRGYDTIDMTTPLALPTLVFPYFLGNDSNDTYWGATAWHRAGGIGDAQYQMQQLFMGSVGFLLAVLAVVAVKDPRVKLMVFVALVSFCWVFLAPLFNPLFSHVPLLSSFRVYFRPVIGLILAVCVLAGFGWDYLRHLVRTSAVMPRALGVYLGVYLALVVTLGVSESVLGVFGPNKPLWANRAYIAVSFSCVVISCLAIWLARRGVMPSLTPAIMFFLAVVELLFVTPSFLRLGDPQYLFPALGSLEFIGSQPGLHRTLVPDARYFEFQFAYAGIEIPTGARHVWKRQFDYMNAAQNDDARLLDGPNIISKSLVELHLPPFSRLLDVANIRFVVVPNAFADYPPKYRPVYKNEATVLENIEALPRAFFVHSYRLKTLPEEILGDLLDPRIDLTDTVVLEETPTHSYSPSKWSGKSAAVEISEYKANRVKIGTDSPEAGFVVLLDTYDSYWRAEIDGVPTQVFCANYLFRAVEVPAGKHEIVFTYRHTPWLVGCVVSGASLLTILVWLIWPRTGTKAASKTCPNPPE